MPDAADDSVAAKLLRIRAAVAAAEHDAQDALAPTQAPGSTGPTEAVPQYEGDDAVAEPAGPRSPDMPETERNSAPLPDAPRNVDVPQADPSPPADQTKPDTTGQDHEESRAEVRRRKPLRPTPNRRPKRCGRAF